MKLYLLRHGQTDYNLRGIIQGDLDIPLNETGQNQAKEAKKKTDNLDIDLIICSPILRAVQTANIVNENNNIPMMIDKRLAERNLGKLLYKEVDCYDEKLYWYVNDNYQDFNNVEPVKDILRRTSEFLSFIKQEYKGKTILVVSHRDPLRAIVMNLIGYGENNLEITNGELIEYEMGD